MLRFYFCRQKNKAFNVLLFKRSKHLNMITIDFEMVIYYTVLVAVITLIISTYIRRRKK